MPETLNMSSVRPQQMIASVGLADVLVAGAGPGALEGAARLLALVPVALGMRGPAHQHLADLAVADLAAGLVDEAQLVAGHGAARGAVAQIARGVGQIDVQHLGRADAVEDVDAELGFFQASPTCSGSASPAETQRRRRREPFSGVHSGSSSMAA